MTDVWKAPKYVSDLYFLQTHHVNSTLKARGNGCFHVVSSWNTRDVFVGFLLFTIFCEAQKRSFDYRSATILKDRKILSYILDDYTN